jgi:pimeloyl-ACP methyl ester carboxylesterase
MPYDISTQIMSIEDRNYEIDVCGNPASEHLALFLHGFPETSYAWRHQMPVLADLGYKCWAPNQRGYGNTYSPQDIKSYNMHCLVSDVAKFIDTSRCKSVTLIGHDWGGVVAWQFALHNARPIDKLIIMNAPHPSIIAEELTNFAQLRKMWYILLFQLPKIPEYLLTRNHAKAIEKLFYSAFTDKSKITDKALDIYKKNALRPGGMTAMLNWYRYNFSHFPRKGREKIIDIPTLIIWGEKDVALGINCAQGTDKYVENLTMHFLPNAGHFVQEEDPEQTNEILSGWLLGMPIQKETSRKA